MPHRPKSEGTNYIYSPCPLCWPPSLVTRACNLSGGFKVIERWFGFAESDLGWFNSGLPVPSLELSQGA
ncbi:hypothetical protein PVK06_003365 [Gossypium arboreum]|uniref:Uncharacterized protein n=1 Tax=Gossypium arboreum TaxID=29729 RepID=A0ABR0R630_GOSAR|nr:hypothetical protein PVK06_003365 [Gossypium arboreum]